jgi:hypothetical protein
MGAGFGEKDCEPLLAVIWISLALFEGAVGLPPESFPQATRKRRAAAKHGTTTRYERIEHLLPNAFGGPGDSGVPSVGVG